MRRSVVYVLCGPAAVPAFEWEITTMAVPHLLPGRAAVLESPHGSVTGGKFLLSSDRLSRGYPARQELALCHIGVKINSGFKR